MPDRAKALTVTVDTFPIDDRIAGMNARAMSKGHHHHQPCHPIREV